MNITVEKGLPAADHVIEVVERKGAGHPDTLADGVAEAVSRAYSNFCLKEFGAILHHNSDKTALLGGAADVTFGHGELTKPITALINGRFTAALGDTGIPVQEIIDKAVRDYLGAALPLLDISRDLVVRPRVTQASSPGAVLGEVDEQQAGRRFWFAPRSLDDLAERARMFSNDTSAGVGYAPAGLAEKVVAGIEQYLTSPEMAAACPWYGTDVKIMVVRHGSEVHITACVPQIAVHTPDLATYSTRRAEARALIREVAHNIAPQCLIDVAVNTRDNDERRELYLTATGSSLESGDEGVVGRGNRANGVISMWRPWSAEGVSGKNPVYHVGKLYNLAAQQAAERLHAETGQTVAVALVSQSGRDLSDPWQVVVQTSGESRIDDGLARRVIAEVMGDLDKVRDGLLSGTLTTA
ncbi:methionine adenosyltransferase [Microtetraspora niveoalba]|uniref:methionine adenosyltransferase n=1 Tax=Microtetraspora niveoalba TaxID=46175 RepID=UPI000AE5E617|nr:methionine adenosyltransferase [Microtetraspora niveoalba]